MSCAQPQLCGALWPAATDTFPVLLGPPAGQIFGPALDVGAAAVCRTASCECHGDFWQLRLDRLVAALQSSKPGKCSCLALPDMVFRRNGRLPREYVAVQPTCRKHGSSTGAPSVCPACVPHVWCNYNFLQHFHCQGCFLQRVELHPFCVGISDRTCMRIKVI